jgi:hypothetical protein
LGRTKGSILTAKSSDMFEEQAPMISERKIEANRRNAQKSSGPRTKLGKAVSRMNAMKHGITAEQVILDGESAKKFKALRRELFEVLAPADAIEAELVQAIIMDQWRLRRHYRAEASLFTELGGGGNLGGGFQAAPQSLATLIRYHAEIERSIHRNLAALARLQERHKAKAVPAPKTPPVQEAGLRVVPAKAHPLRDAHAMTYDAPAPHAPAVAPNAGGPPISCDLGFQDPSPITVTKIPPESTGMAAVAGRASTTPPVDVVDRKGG